MCGICGIVSYGGAVSYTKSRLIRKATTALLKNSKIRGSDASGMCIVTGIEAHLFKNNIPSTELVQTNEYSDLLGSIKHGDRFRAAIGHTRQKTKGSQYFNINNHPIRAGDVIGVHNGMISNDDYLFDQLSEEIERGGQVDSEIIFSLINYHMSNGKDIVEAVKSTHSSIMGSYACAFVNVEEPRYTTIFTNAKSYSNAVVYVYDNLSLIAFASSDYILNTSLRGNSGLDPEFATAKLELSSEGIRIDTETGKIHRFDLGDKDIFGDPYTAPWRSGRPEGKKKQRSAETQEGEQKAEEAAAPLMNKDCCMQGIHFAGNLCSGSCDGL